MKLIDGKVFDNQYEEFSKLGELDENLASAAVRGMSKNSSKELIFDYSLKMRMNGGKALAVALALKDYISKNFPNEKRIGIVLPSCLPGFLVNIAVQMAGKTSVNINFTMGSSAAKACLRKTEIKSIIGSEKVRQKVSERSPDFPWTDNFLDIGKILKSIGKARIAKKLIAVSLLPSWALIKLFRIPTRGGNEEASIIFTSGSEGEPKAAVLTHRNLISNVYQMKYSEILQAGVTLHANLPLFHSFGQTIQVWLSAILGVRQVSVQSPLEVQANLEAMKEGGSSLMISTPTFLRSYYKKGTSEHFKSMKMVIAGAEKTPDGFMDMWCAKFPNVKYLDGYGLTEASPVVCVNLPEGLPTGRFRKDASGTRPKSVGQIFCGMRAKVCDPESGAALRAGETGILHLQSPSIFAGYLNQPDLTEKKLRDGWLDTGDLAFLDEDGYLYIKGRLSRFSKIGGEMIPHSTLEDVIAKAYGVEESDVPMVAVGSKIDENKGEALVVLAAFDIDPKDLRKKLVDAGLPNLWMPRNIVRVEKIPVLSTGKLDLAAIRRECAK